MNMAPKYLYSQIRHYNQTSFCLFASSAFSLVASSYKKQNHQNQSTWDKPPSRVIWTKQEFRLCYSTTMMYTEPNVPVPHCVAEQRAILSCGKGMCFVINGSYVNVTLFF